MMLEDRGVSIATVITVLFVLNRPPPPGFLFAVVWKAPVLLLSLQLW